MKRGDILADAVFITLVGSGLHIRWLLKGGLSTEVEAADFHPA